MTEICQDEVFILDHEGPVVSQGTSTGMPDLVVEPTAGYVKPFLNQLCPTEGHTILYLYSERQLHMCINL